MRYALLRSVVFVLGAFAVAVAIYFVLQAVAGGLGAFSPDSADRRTAGPPVSREQRAAANAAAQSTERVDSPVQIRIRSPEAAPGLKNDSSGPLFVEMNMAPGATSSRCLSVTNVGVQLAEVRFFGAIADAGLASHVSLLVEAGKGARDESCTGFAGAPLYEGSLSDLSSSHRTFATGISAPELVYPNESLSFRLTQRLNETSPQGVRASARFGWEARGAGAPSPLQKGRDPLAYHTGKEAPPAAETRPERSIPSIVMDAAVEVAKRGWTWMILLAFVVGFLIVQDRIDRRDPRLAGARVRPEPDIAFADARTPADMEAKP